MCGFTFCYDPDLGTDGLRQRGEAALASMRHRGPDDERLQVHAPWSIGNCRLAIVDLAASRQPMSDPGGRWWLSYNGEIYNYAALRAALEESWTFRTRGDTEVLLAGLVLHGTAFLDRLEGMWGFALWDAAEEKLLLGRDRLGQKPAFYRAAGGRLAASSELPTLATLAPGDFSEDWDSTADLLRYGYPLPGRTAYRGVHEVLPGHVARWTPGGGVDQERYWAPAVGGFKGHRETAREELDAVLTRAVERRLVADVEVGAFLSGGIDSSLVVGILAHRVGASPRTFTIGFTDAAYDERPHARRVARRWGLANEERVVESWDRRRLVELVLEHCGQPFSDSSLLPTAAVCGLAAEHVKVALSGDGGDELFSGYRRYLGRSLLRLYSRLPAAVCGAGESAAAALSELGGRWLGARWAHRFLDIVARQRESHPYVAPRVLTEGQLTALAPCLAERGHRPPPLPPAARRDEILEMMVGDLVVYLPQDILVKVDRASMACSLEVRSPFLDRGVVELALSLPIAFHRRGGTGKRLLRETFPDLLPAAAWRRRKQGFAVPVHAWFRGELADELGDLLATDPGPVEPAAARALLAAHRDGVADHGSRLWILYVYLLWRLHGGRPGRSPGAAA